MGAEKQPYTEISFPGLFIIAITPKRNVIERSATTRWKDNRILYRTEFLLLSIEQKLSLENHLQNLELKFI